MSQTPPRPSLGKRCAPATPSGPPPSKGRPDPASFFRGGPPPSTGSLSPLDYADEPSSPTPGPSGGLPFDDPSLDPNLTPEEAALIADQPMEDDTEESFTELTNWIRYISAKPAQVSRLAHTLNAILDEVRLLSGEREEPKPTFAAIAATPAGTSAKVPKLGKSIPTTKTLTNAIYRFERASKELPGASRSDIINLVAASDLTKPVPPSTGIMPKKRKPTCLVQGVRNNVVAVRLPATAPVPATLATLTKDVNALLKERELPQDVKEVHLGLRHHLNITFFRPPSEEVGKTALDFCLSRFSVPQDQATQVSPETHAILKFIAVPLFLPNGKTCKEIHAKAFIRQHPDWKDVDFLEDPRFIIPKGISDPITATLQVKVKDVRKGTTMKKLLNTSIAFAGVIWRCQPWTVTKPARQCSTCLRWGHTTFVCRAIAPACAICAGGHPTHLHDLHAKRCKSSNCTHATVRCINCYDTHLATSTECPFFKARTTPQKLTQLQAERKAQKDAGRKAPSRRSRRTGTEEEEG